MTPVKPFVAVDEAVQKQTFDEWRGRSAATIQSERDKVESDMERIVEQAGPDLDLAQVEALDGQMLAEKCAAMVGINSRLAGLEDALRERTELEQVAQDIRDGNRGGGEDPDPKQAPRVVVEPRAEPTIADRFFAELRARGKTLADVAAGGVKMTLSMPGREQFNTLFETGAGWDPFVTRRPGYIASPQREIQVTDVFPTSPTGQNAISYLEETTFDNTSAEVAEGTASPEAELKQTERTQPVREIAVEIPVTKVQLEDEQQVTTYLNERLLFMTRQRVDGQLLKGDGIAPNMEGVLSRTGLLDYDFTHNVSNDIEKPFNALKKAKTKTAVDGRCMPSHYILHHSIWDDASLSESSAGGYYLGSPAEMFVERCWGLPVVKSDHLSDGSDTDEVGGLVGDFMNFSRLHVRRDFGLEVGFSGDDFSKRQVRIQATVRITLEVSRPSAFCTLTRP